jgi:hypothetical protein
MKLIHCHPNYEVSCSYQIHISNMNGKKKKAKFKNELIIYHFIFGM